MAITRNLINYLGIPVLIIRSEQMRALEKPFTDPFVIELVQHLRDQLPEACAACGGEAEVTAFAQRAIPRAAGHGIDTKGGVKTLAEQMMRYGENLERSPIREWSLNVLRRTELPGQVKVDLIREKHDELTRGRTIVTG